MAHSTNPLPILKDPEVRKYFVSILQSDLSGDQKYERLIDFFELEGQVKTEMLHSYGDQLLASDVDKIGEMASAAGQKIGIWKPDEILLQTHDSIRRALQRLKNSQHRDGGWGFQVELSSPWGTAYSVLCLNGARRLRDFDLAFEENLEKGSSWLKEHSSEWSIENIDFQGSRSVYDVSIVIRCCYETGNVGFPSLDQSWRKLSESQNEDGGWDAGIWADNYSGPSRVYSDVGATSTALQALAAVKRYMEPQEPFELGAIFLNGMQWFIRTQNDDGSWNNKSCTPTSTQIEGFPSITKTCDAIKGILTARDSLLQLDAETIAAGNQALENAVNWLLGQEKPLYDRGGNIAGWGWGAETIGNQKIADMENTWLTLETLVQIELESISLPLLTANAQWLMKQQHKPDTNEDTVEDGKWEPKGHTARIALSLIEFYKKIKGSPLFEKTTDEKSASVAEASQ